MQYEELSGSHKSAFNFRYLCLYEQPNTDTRQGGYGHIENFLKGVPVSGLYDIEVEAQAMHRDTHYDPKIFGIDFSEPFILGLVPGDVIVLSAGDMIPADLRHLPSPQRSECRAAHH